MADKQIKPEQILLKLRRAKALLAGGQSTAEVCLEVGVDEEYLDDVLENGKCPFCGQIWNETACEHIAVSFELSPFADLPVGDGFDSECVEELQSAINELLRAASGRAEAIWDSARARAPEPPARLRALVTAVAPDASKRDGEIVPDVYAWPQGLKGYFDAMTQERSIACLGTTAYLDRGPGECFDWANYWSPDGALAAKAMEELVRSDTQYLLGIVHGL